MRKTSPLLLCLRRQGPPLAALLLFFVLFLSQMIQSTLSAEGVVLLDELETNVVSSPLSTNTTTINNNNPSASSYRTLLSVFPFTVRGETTVTYYRNTPSRRRIGTPLGFSHMAAFYMAMQHFNNRNPIVVPQLAALSLMEGCHEYFDLANSTVGDSQGSKEGALLAVLEQAFQGHRPHAIIDGYYFQEAPALQLAALADTLQVPLVSSGGYDMGLVATTTTSTTARGSSSSSSNSSNNNSSSSSTQQQQQQQPNFASRVFADGFALSIAAVQYLTHIGRNDYIGLLHSINPTSSQLQESIEFAAQQVWGGTMTMQAFSYVPPYYQAVMGNRRGIDTALAALVQTGYRTIVVILEDLLVEIPLLAKAAKNLNMNRQDYVWILLGDFDVEFFVYYIEMASDPDIAELLLGTAAIQPAEGFTQQGLLLGQNNDDSKMNDNASHKNDDNAFLSAWAAQQGNQDMIDWLRSKYPIAQGLPGYYEPPDDFFQTLGPGIGSGFVYDAVMAVGLGLCATAAAGHQQGNATSSDGGDTSSTLLVEGVRSTSFDGASGHVEFEKDGMFSGRRVGHSVGFAAFNIRLPTEDHLEILCVTDIFKGTKDGLEDRTWTSVLPFVYADGRTEPPALLRAIPPQNYLKRSSRIYGLLLFGISTTVCLLAGVWVYWNRGTRVLRAAQPEFLFLVIFGAALVAAPIVPNTLDEGLDWTAQSLGRACTLVPWLVSTGFMAMYTGLWCKLWRANKVLQFARRRIKVQSVIAPAAMLFTVVLTILTLWTILEGFQWQRLELDEETGESAGSCTGNSTAAWFTPILILMMIPPILTARMAWATRDVDKLFSESQWIVILVVSQFQLLLMCIPLLLLIDKKSPNVRYLGQSTVFAVMSLTTMILIFGPKYYMLYFDPTTSAPPKRKTHREKGDSAGRGNGTDVSKASHTVTEWSGYMNSPIPTPTPLVNPEKFHGEATQS
jgi:hypothetical protein